MTADVLAPEADARLRAALDAAATAAPVAPAWDAIRERVEIGDVVVLRPPRRWSPALVAAAAVVVLIALAGLAVAVGQGDDGDVTAAEGDEAYCAVLERASRAGHGVVVFLDPGAAPAAVERAIDGTGLAEDVTYVDRDSAFAEVRRLFADDPTMRDRLRPEDVPTSFRVTVADGAAARQLAAAVEGTPGVLSAEQVRFGRLIDVLRSLDDGHGARPFYVDERVDDDVADALAATVPDELAAAAATVGPVLRSRQGPDPGQAAAARTLVADADARCGTAPIMGPDPTSDSAPETATTTTEPG